ncbi:MAG TPA: hypothetical protein VGF30_13940 [Bacteroidia bacterium]
MNIKEAILEEHSKAQRDRIVKYIGTDKKRFKELLDLFLGSEYRVTQRAAWAVSSCAELYPELIKPYLNKLVDNLDLPDQHDAVKRNTLRIFQFMDVPEKSQGKLYDISLRFLLSMHEPIAIKAFSITVLQNLALVYPDLQQELKVIFSDLAKHETSPAVVHRAKKALKEFNK